MNVLKGDHLKQDFKNTIAFSRRGNFTWRPWIFNHRVVNVPSRKLDWLGVEMCHLLVFSMCSGTATTFQAECGVFLGGLRVNLPVVIYKQVGRWLIGWMSQWVFFVLMCYGKALNINCHQPKVRKASFSHLFSLIFLIVSKLTVLNSLLLAYNFLLHY